MLPVCEMVGFNTCTAVERRVSFCVNSSLVSMSDYDNFLLRTVHRFSLKQEQTVIVNENAQIILSKFNLFLKRVYLFDKVLFIFSN